MPIRRSRGLRWTAGLLLFWLAGCHAPATRGVAVDRYDVALTVLTDGSVDAVETIALRAETPGARFSRNIAALNLDRIVDVSTTADGRPPDASGGEAHVDRSGGLQASWPIAAGDGAAHTLTLRYRVIGALPVEGTRGVLRWSVLPVNRTYAVGSSRVDLIVPAGTHFAAGPSVEGGRAPFRQEGDRSTVDLGRVERADATVVSAEIVLDALTLPEPEWQAYARGAHQLIPAFVSAAVCLIVVGIGILIMIRLQYPPHPAAAGPVAPAEPNSLPPAMVAALTTNRARTGPAVQSAMVESLIRRGILHAADGSGGDTMVGVPSDAGSGVALVSHERVAIAALIPGAAPSGRMNVSETLGRLQAAQRRIEKALLVDLLDAGLFDQGRLAAAQGLRATGFVALAVGAAGVAAIAFVLTRFGTWPMAVPLSVLVVGGLFLWASLVTDVLTEKGSAVRAAWRSR